MKTKKTIFYLFLSFVFLSVFSCGDKKTIADQDKLLAHIPMPAKLDSAMRQSFDTVTYKILKGINPKNVKSFKITKENYLKMIDNIPANANRVAFSFVQFNKANFQDKYQELNKYDGCLYLLYYYMDANGKNVGDKAYAMLGTQSIIEISAADFQVMENAYAKNIKPSIDKVVKGPQGNTLRVKMNKDELIAYKARVIAKPNIKNFKITLAQWVGYNNYLTKSELDFLINKLSQFSDDSEGQMTFITDCQDNSGGDVEDLSGSDINNFCPNNCP